jgi:SH3-like domain-containing protein
MLLNPMRSMHHIIVSASLTLVLTGCLPEPEPAVDEATVLTDNTSMRIDATASARTMYTLSEGERVSILEKRGTWYRVRDRDQIEGWMDESTIISDRAITAMRLGVSEAASQPVQNTASVREEVNLRLAPGRDTEIIRRLRRRTSLEVLERSTTPRPDSDATDVWFKVRPSQNEIGWVYSQLIEFNTPEPLQPFMEGRTYVAVQKLRQVEDPPFGLIDWFVVAERRDDTEADISYDGIRVFVWNLEEHQYETTLRLRNLQGAYPLERTGESDNPGFRFHVEEPDGSRLAREFAMRETLPREVRQ